MSRRCGVKLLYIPLNFISRPVTIPHIALAESDNTDSTFLHSKTFSLNYAFMAKKRLLLVQEGTSEDSKCSTTMLFVVHCNIIPKL